MIHSSISTLILFFLPVMTFAAVPAWQIIPNESNLTFKAIQNNAPVTGKFNKFTGDIQVDPAQLNASHVRIVVDIGSISTSYQDLTATLLTPDWFNAKLFPQAVFTADKFIKKGDRTYQVMGTLTIRNKSVPVTISVIQDDYSNTMARVHGNVTIKRTSFGVGQGEWTSTNEVKDDVQVNFTLVAKQRPR